MYILYSLHFQIKDTVSKHLGNGLPIFKNSTIDVDNIKLKFYDIHNIPFLIFRPQDDSLYEKITTNKEDIFYDPLGILGRRIDIKGTHFLHVREIDMWDKLLYNWGLEYKFIPLKGG